MKLRAVTATALHPLSERVVAKSSSTPRRPSPPMPVAQEHDPIRTCGVCRRAKSIRGVWYLLPPGSRVAPFVCETCFAQQGMLKAS